MISKLMLYTLLYTILIPITMFCFVQYLGFALTVTLTFILDMILCICFIKFMIRLVNK